MHSAPLVVFLTPTVKIAAELNGFARLENVVPVFTVQELLDRVFAEPILVKQVFMVVLPTRAAADQPILPQPLLHQFAVQVAPAAETGAVTMIIAQDTHVIGTQLVPGRPV